MHLFYVITEQGRFEIQATCDIAAELEIAERGHGVAIKTGLAGERHG